MALLGSMVRFRHRRLRPAALCLLARASFHAWRRGINHLGEKSHRKASRHFREADEREASIREFRWVAVQIAVGKALDEYNPATGRPERSDFNRNASAHRVKRPQYRQVNALSALMLVTALLLELNDFPRGEEALQAK